MNNQQQIITANSLIHKKLNKLDIQLHSPLSMTYALMLTYLGSSGDTATVLENLFGLKKPAFGLGKINKIKIVDELTKIKNSFESYSTICKITNGIFVKKNLNIVKSYVDITKSLNINIQMVDFSDKLTVTKINKWIADNTKNLITNILSPDDIDDRSMLVLINCIYFKGKWMHSFDSELTNLNGLFNGKKATMMRKRKDDWCKYYSDEKQQVVELQYEDGFSMGFVLPKKNESSYYDLETNVEKYFDKMTYTDVHVTIPKFEQKLKIRYKQHAEALGISKLFETTNLKELIDCNDLCISEIIQEVVVKVDEDGSEAAAATAVLILKSCAVRNKKEPIVFVADHSFVYYIKHDETNIVMFKGTLTEV